MASPNASLREGQAILNWLATQQSQMLDLLRTIVNIDSNSYDKAGVDRVGDEIRRFLEEHNVPVSTIPMAEYGDILRTQVGGGNAKPILLMGHRDTVFSTGTAVARPFTVKDGRAYGPGVADMKSGLVMNCFVLAAFAQHGSPSASLVGLFTGDEEIGSPASRPIIEAEARGAYVALNSEAGRANGDVVIARRGCIFIALDIEGRSAHSGVNFADGNSAIAELGHKVTALHALTRLADQVSVNVGMICGGQSVNTVAPSASAKIDVRYYRAEDRERVLGDVAGIAEASKVSGTRSKWRIYGEFPPVITTPASAALLAVYRESAAELGVTLDGALTAGAADSGFSAGVGTPTLCGVGPVGGRYHSDDEYMEIASLLTRTQALASTILRLADRPALDAEKPGSGRAAVT